MKHLQTFLLEALINKKVNHNKMIIPKDKEELIKIIKERINQEGPNCDLNNIDVSHLTDLSNIFSAYYGGVANFDGDISEWDVSNCISMSMMFYHSKYTGNNGDLSNWNVSNVENMNAMFCNSNYQGKFTNWQTDSLTRIEEMFSHFSITQDISMFDVSKVKYCKRCFNCTHFNGHEWDIKNWKFGAKQIMCDYMFEHCPDNPDLSKWNTSEFNSCTGMFKNSAFNGDISNWDVSNVRSMREMFFNCPFNGDVSNWDVSNCHDFCSIFERSNFSGDTSKWKVNKMDRVTDAFKKSPLSRKKPEWAK